MEATYHTRVCANQFYLIWNFLSTRWTRLIVKRLPVRLSAIMLPVSACAFIGLQFSQTLINYLFMM